MAYICGKSTGVLISGKLKRMLKLYMILVGFKPEGFITEQHDIVFALGFSIADPRINATILKRLPIPSKTRVHIDAWVEVLHVGGYRVTVKEGSRPDSAEKLDLYFANLGGYKREDFTEHHKKLLIIASDSAEIKTVAEQDSFYREMDAIPRAQVHIDNRGRLNAEVEDELRVSDVLDGYHLLFEPDPDGIESLKYPIIEGYMKIGEKP